MDNLNFLQEKTEKVIKTSVDCYTQTLNSVVSTAVNTEEIQVLSNTVRNINIQNRTNQYYSTREIASRILNYSKNVTQKFRETNRVHVEEHENLIDWTKTILESRLTGFFLGIGFSILVFLFYKKFFSSSDNTVINNTVENINYTLNTFNDSPLTTSFDLQELLLFSGGGTALGLSFFYFFSKIFFKK
jgi:hypothetical protein